MDYNRKHNASGFENVMGGGLTILDINILSIFTVLKLFVTLILK